MKIKSIEVIHHPDPIPVYDVIDVEPFHNFVCKGADNNSFVAHNCAVMDEINFSRAGIKDVSKAKQHMRDLYNTVSARVKGTFRMEGEVYGKIFAVSSKRGDSDFMEAYIQEQLEAGFGNHMLIADAPQWEVLPKSMFSEGHFYIAVGDRHKKGFVVPDNQTFPEALEELESQGYQLLTPPIDMKSDFLADFEIALRDLAGIAVVGALSFITQAALTGCIDTSRRSPFYQDILQIGTQDAYTIQEFFHLDDVPQEYKRMPCFIHLDLSLNTDKTGLGCVCINGRKDIEDENGKVTSFPTFGHIFSISIEAPRGDKIPYSKIIAFIKWLRDKGFNISGISRDQYQSEYVGQLLEEQGFNVKKLSLDRTPDGYVALRSVLLEHRINMLDHQLLQNELIHLQRDGNTGKIDHPTGGCFTLDTKIRLIDGVKTIEEILNEFKYKEFYTYSADVYTYQKVVKKIERVFRTKVADTLVEIQLDNNEIIRCTLDHRFLLRNGKYREAQDLSINSKLMSCDTIGSLLGNYHSIKNIRLLTGLEEPVYDLTIADIHNFSLDAGVFVHNSKDTADGFAGAVWNAILTNPGVPVPTKSVAKAMQSINQKTSPYKGYASVFGNYRKL